MSIEKNKQRFRCNQCLFNISIEKIVSLMLIMIKKEINKKRRTNNVDELIKMSNLIKINEIVKFNEVVNIFSTITNTFVQDFCKTTTTNFYLIDINEFND